ncbi:kinase-like domain-containing protein [Rhizophagus clarus]|nr:kinase-like domain-containing protein [Rhizophagus clarus]
MGLCGKIDDVDETNIYGVIPYIAPEVFRGKSYTQASDIYSFGMIMYFVATSIQPFAHCAHDEHLVLDICNGIRPEINELEAPKCYIDLMKKCWDPKPENRPKSTELHELVSKFWRLHDYSNIEISLAMVGEVKQFKEAEIYRRVNLTNIENNKTTSHKQAIYTSRLLNPFTKNLSEYNNNKTECLDC